MAFKVCSSCGTQVQQIDSHCWHCQSVTFQAELADGIAAVPTMNRPAPALPKTSEPGVSPRTRHEKVTAMGDLVHTSIADRHRSTLVKQLSGILLLTLLVVAGQGWQIVRGMSVKSQSWEYLIEGPTDEQLQAKLQALGSAGWELVSARRATTEVGGKTAGIYEMAIF